MAQGHDASSDIGIAVGYCRLGMDGTEMTCNASQEARDREDGLICPCKQTCELRRETIPSVVVEAYDAIR
jgi:hypothetical protein